MKTHTQKREGFTLIEIMIAVFILGVLLLIAIPALSNYRRNARATAFSHDVRMLTAAGQQYSLEAGDWAPDTTPGVFPAELEGYISEKKFESDTAVGGKWDYDQWDRWDYTSIVGVEGATSDEDVLQLVDKLIDDGNLGTGYFQKLGEGQYYFIIEE